MHETSSLPGKPTDEIPGKSQSSNSALRSPPSRKAFLHMYVLVCICIHLVSECAPSRRLLPTSPSLAGWPGRSGERGTCARSERSGPTPSAFRHAGWPCGSGTEGAPAAIAECLCWWNAKGGIGAAIAMPSFRSYSDFTGSQPINWDYALVQTDTHETCSRYASQQ